MKKYKLLILALIVFLCTGLSFTSRSADQADFPLIYIDADAGDGGVGSQADPYNDFADINWTTGGDDSIFDYLAGSPSQSPYVYLQKGDEWREQLTVVTSGLAAYRIIIGAYGTGADPIINGADLIETGGDDWTDASPPANSWSAGVTTEPDVVLFDGTVGIKEAAEANLDTEFEWFWEANVLYVYSTSDPDTAYVSPGIEAGARLYGIFVNNKDYITIDGIDTKYANYSGIDLYIADNCIIQNTENSYHYGHGIRLNTQCDDNLVDSNICHHQVAGEGILLQGSDPTPCGSGNTFSNNTCYDNNDGIQIIGSGQGATEADNIIEGNTFYNHPLKHGFISELCKDTIARYNICYDNSQGIGLYSEDSPQVYYNVCYSNITAEINIARKAGEGDGCDNALVYNNVMYADTGGAYALQISVSTNNTIKNNIGYTADNGLVYALVVVGASTITACDNNCWYAPNSSEVPDVNYNINAGATWAEWQTATYDAEGLNEDPLFTTLGSDFTLQSSSPCIDVGADVSLTQDYARNSVPRNGGYITVRKFFHIAGSLYQMVGSLVEGIVDIGAYEYLISYKIKNGHLYLRLSDRLYLRIY